MNHPLDLVRRAPQWGAPALLALAVAFATAQGASAADAPPPPASARPIPAGDYALPGTTPGVGDEIEIALQAEFTGPPLPAAAASAASAASK